MATLEERKTESIYELERRLTNRQEALQVSPAMSKYIELLEKYILELEERVVNMEKKLNYECDQIHIITG